MDDLKIIIDAGRKQLFSTKFDDLNKDLSQREAYFLRCIATNKWVSKSGIYTLHAIMLAATLGFAKVLEPSEVEEIEKEFSTISDPQERSREIMSKQEQLAIKRMKDMFDVLQRKGKLKYDYANHLMYVIDFHKYVPFGSAAPKIICDDIMRGISENENHPFWADYLQKNSVEIKQFLTQSTKNAERSKSPETTLLHPSFLRLKKLTFLDDKKI